MHVLSSNGYSLFTIETLPLISHLPNNERLGEVSRRWKKLSEDKKEAYNLKAEEVNFVIEETVAVTDYEFVGLGPTGILGHALLIHSCQVLLLSVALGRNT